MLKRSALALLVATRKGAFILKSDAGRRSWKTSAPIMLGQIAHHMVQDPRNPRVLMLSMRTGGKLILIPNPRDHSNGAALNPASRDWRASRP